MTFRKHLISYKSIFMFSNFDNILMLKVENQTAECRVPKQVQRYKQKLIRVLIKKVLACNHDSGYLRLTYIIPYIPRTHEFFLTSTSYQNKNLSSRIL